MNKLILIILGLIILYLVWNNIRILTKRYYQNTWKPYNIRVKYEKEISKYRLLIIIIIITIIFTLLY